MTKKNIRPQQAAPVQRETVGTNFAEGKITAHVYCPNGCGGRFKPDPFAGDDAE